MKIKRVFSDSREGVLSIQKKNVNIRYLKTSSPELILKPIEGVKTISMGNKNDKILSDLMNLMVSISEEIFLDCTKKKLSNNFSALITFEIYSLFRKLNYLISLTNEEIDSKDNLLIDIIYKKGSIHLETNNPLNNIFTHKIDNIKIISTKKKEKNLSKLQLFRITTVKELEFYFWNKFSKFHPKLFSKGTILHNRYSSLLSESLINLARDGYRLQKVDLPKIKPMKIDEETIDFLNKIVIRKVVNLLEKYLGKKKGKILKKIFSNDIFNSLSLYFGAKKYWEIQLDYFKSIKTQAFCHSFIIGPIWHALAETLSRNKIIICGFQHGHGKEFSEVPSYSKTYNEMVSSDLYFCYSNKSALVSQNNKNSMGKAYPVGLPYFYNFKHNFFLDSLEKTKFMYVSTCLYSTYIMGIQTLSWSDVKKADVEISIIENILSRIDDKCIYKAYPMKSNLENELIENKVKKYKNLIYTDISYDLNIIKNHSDVLITSRATSTLGWCLASGKPVIFINYNDHYSVTDEFKVDAINSFFYFEFNEKNFNKKILNLLNKSIEEIISEWDLMKDKREILWEKYFAVDSFNKKSEAGKRVCEIIKKEIS